MRDEFRVKKLADYLSINPEDIQVAKYGDQLEYRTEEGTFWVLDEDESRQATYDDIENTMDDLGLESFTEEFRDWIIEHALDDEWFETACEESERSYAEAIQEEPDRQENGKYANRLIQECIENDLISDNDIVNGDYVGKEDLVELLTEYIVENIRRDYSSFCEWYQKNLGGVDYLIKHDIISVDMDAIVDKCIELDGYGHFISSWDGDTIELDGGLFAYKQSDRDERE